MKQSSIFPSLLMFLAILSGMGARAADLVVAAGGAGGAYASLNAAIAAASAGDRIIVYPQSNGAAYSETAITLTKSLQILSANEGAFYSIDAPSITIAPTTAGSTITIIGMRLLTGNIVSSIAAPTGARCNVNILNDSLVQGGLNINHDNYNLTAAANFLNAGLLFRFGKVIGNYMNSALTINTDASVNNPNDTVMIIGNRIHYYTSLNAGGIQWNSTGHFFAIQNNFVRLDYPDNYVNYGIYVITAKNSSSGVNSIINNTVLKQTYSIFYGILVATPAIATTEVLNNIVHAPIYWGGLALGAGNYSVHYNYVNTASYSGFTNDGTNLALLNTTINSATGAITTPLSNCINGGTVDSAYADIDLTRNDAGCYGGSYTLDNFFPITANDWARVILVTAPRRVLVNGTINVKAIGFDK
jgi:hypothetical protein